MYPQLNIFGKIYNSYTVMMIIAVTMAVLLVFIRNKYFKLSKFKLFMICLIAPISFYLGCNLLLNLESYKEVLKNGWILFRFSGYGGILFTPPIMVLLAKLIKVPMGKTLDIWANGLATAMVFIRIGCYLAGCCGGGYLTESDGVYHYIPTQLFDSGLNLLILIQIIIFQSKHKFENVHFMFYLLEYGLGRFIIEFFRDTQKDTLLMSHGQIFSLIAIALGILMFVVNRKNIIKELKGAKHEK